MSGPIVVGLAEVDILSVASVWPTVTRPGQ